MKKSAFIIVFILPLFTFSQQSSVLSSGEWYKLAVEETGIYQITYNDLIDYGIDVANVDPRKLALYGNPAGMLPEELDKQYYTDLQEMAIQVIGEVDGIFDEEDYILFFGQSPHQWKYEKVTKRFHHIKHLYSERTCYFLTVGNNDGKRIQLQNSTGSDPTGWADLYEVHLGHEAELVNPGKTGKIWLEEFPESDMLSLLFETDNTEYNEESPFRVALAASCTEASSFTILINDEEYKHIQISPLNGSYQLYRYLTFDSLFTHPGYGELKITLIYNRPNDSAIAWLDYFETDVKKNPVIINVDQASFRSTMNVGPGEITDFGFIHSMPESVTIWNVTNPLNVTNIGLKYTGDDNLQFKIETDSLLEFHSVTGTNYYESEYIGQVENQDLHSIESPDLLIITHPDFVSQANQLALFHENEDGMSSVVYTTEQVYNEFSTGSQDITAIRNFVRYLHDKSGDSQKPDYLLLFGDASYDYLDRVEYNTNYVPTFESLESANVVFSYASDDFYGLKNPGSSESVQLGIGRFIVTSGKEADAMIDKIMSYSSADILNQYKNEWMFIGDNGDNNLHIKDADFLSDMAHTASPVFNFTKNYLDFFNPTITEAGPRIPEVNEITNAKVNDGVFYVNYNGHGGPERMAQENVLTKSDIDAWNKNNLLSIWVTSACAIGWYDNPEAVSLAEYIILKEKAGAIGALVTSRPTFASANLLMNLEVINRLADPEKQAYLRLGDLAAYPGNRSNNEKWVLLGDPALKIPFPEFNISTTKINGQDIDEYTDTIAPGSSIMLSGQVESKMDGSLQLNFHGNVYLKVFAPEYSKPTVGYQSPVEEIIVMDSILTTGGANVIDGEFEIQVVLPSHIYENTGNLKLSWYAENGETDANGFYDGLNFGGEPDGIGEQYDLVKNIKVYPTFFSDGITLENHGIHTEKALCRLYNTSGILVFRIDQLIHPGTNSIILPLLEKGMYILSVKTETGSDHYKLFKK